MDQPITSSATPAMSEAVASALTALATAQGMSVQEFVFGGIGLILAPMEQRIADRIIDELVSKFGKTAEIGKQNADLQNDFPDTTDHAI